MYSYFVSFVYDGGLFGNCVLNKSKRIESEQDIVELTKEIQDVVGDKIIILYFCIIYAE